MVGVEVAVGHAMVGNVGIAVGVAVGCRVGVAVAVGMVVGAAVGAGVAVVSLIVIVPLIVLCLTDLPCSSYNVGLKNFMGWLPNGASGATSRFMRNNAPWPEKRVLPVEETRTTGKLGALLKYSTVKPLANRSIPNILLRVTPSGS